MTRGAAAEEAGGGRAAAVFEHDGLVRKEERLDRVDLLRGRSLDIRPSRERERGLRVLQGSGVHDCGVLTLMSIITLSPF